MNVTLSPDAGSSTNDPIAQKKQKQQDILNDKTFNAWQKKYKLDELDQKDNDSTVSPYPFTVKPTSDKPITDIPVRSNPPTSLRDPSILDKILAQHKPNPNSNKNSNTSLASSTGQPKVKSIEGWTYAPPKVNAPSSLFPSIANSNTKQRQTNLFISHQQTLNDSYTSAGHAGINAAKEYLDNIINDNGFTDYTPSQKVANDRVSYLTKNQYRDIVSVVPDLGLSAIKGFGNATSEFGGPAGAAANFNPWLGDAAVQTFLNFVSPEPSFRELLNRTHDDVVKKKLSEFYDKIKYINSSDFKYLVSAPGHIYGDNPLNPEYNYVNTIQSRVKNLINMKPTYGSDSEKEQYKADYLSYLNKVLRMNMDKTGQYYSELDSALNDFSR